MSALPDVPPEVLAQLLGGGQGPSGAQALQAAAPPPVAVVDPTANIMHAIDLCATAAATAVGSSPGSADQAADAALKLAQTYAALHPPAKPAPTPPAGPPIGGGP